MTLVAEISVQELTLNKDSCRNGRNAPTLIFENLKPVEISKNHFNIIFQVISFLKFLMVCVKVSESPKKNADLFFSKNLLSVDPCPEKFYH